MDLLSPKGWWDNADDLDNTDPGTLSEDDILLLASQQYAVGSPTAPEVHHTRTILFAAEVCVRECAVKGISCLLYIHPDFSLHST